MPNDHRDRPPVEDYALLGDTRTAALVASDGAIDWWCIPRFDAQPVFGRLVGGPDAGSFTMGPAGPATVRVRRYRPASATVETTWETPGGCLTLTEGMVGEVSGRMLPAILLVRRLSASGAPIEAVLDFDPRLGPHHRRPRSRNRGEVLVCSWPGTAIAVHTSPPVALEAGRPVTVTNTPGEPLTVAAHLVYGLALGVLLEAH
jgi:hypothetical protein